MSSEFLIIFLNIRIITSFFINNLDFSYNYYFIFSSIIGIIIFWLTSHYKAKTSYLNEIFTYHIYLRNLLFTITFLFINSLFIKLDLPFVFFFLLFFGLNSFLNLFRVLLSNLLSNIEITTSKKVKVAIYGTELTAIQLAYSLKLNSKYSISCFIDESLETTGRSFLGIKIVKLDDFINKNIKVEQILFAKPFLPKAQKIKIINKIQKTNIPLLEVPSIESIINIKYGQSISLEYLLSRDNILKNNNEDLFIGIKNKNILITGAAGSIGSEIFNQILNLEPNTIILLDHSELGLYNLNIRFENCTNLNQVKFILGSTLNKKQFEELLSDYKINIVFHAAAYKHVPLVENNPIQGLLNNVISTKIICESCASENIEKVVLISSDKAVRPTNVMGASKRLSELIFQAFQKESKLNNKKTIFSTVRFGNVIGSSGSVIPLFEKQIKNGGPVTVTHREVTRYFMTIPEAASLVIQTIKLSKGGEIFLLDMGKPINIYDLAVKMINLSGMTLKDNNNPNGNIPIQITGLRRGEKLYEELLIENDSCSTQHPMIFIANERQPNPKIIIQEIKKLEILLRNNDLDCSIKLLSKLVPEWKNSF